MKTAQLTGKEDIHKVQRYSEAKLPTKFGLLNLVVYRDSRDQKEHTAIICGDVSGGGKVPARVHSECFTGEVLHSLKCDCREQLDIALEHISANGRGVVVYLKQEGRGIGLGNKVKAYALQSQGADTVDANRMLGFEDDLRTYEVAAEIFRDLGVKSIDLLTNNPAKISALQTEGVEVLSRIPIAVTKGEHNSEYLSTKQERMGHTIPES